MAVQRQRVKTASICTSETEECSHSFTISGYSHQIVGVGTSISSPMFTVGGHGWRIRYFPEGDGEEECDDYVAVYLDLVSQPSKPVKLMHNFKLVNKTTRQSSSIFSSPNVLTAVSPSSWGTSKFMEKSEIVSTYLRDDYLEIECDVIVIKESRLEEISIKSDFNIHVPPSNLSDDLGNLFRSGEGTDITFKVKGEVFRAHKSLLATRSPVFREELCGLMTRDKKMEGRTVEGMEPTVFKELLYFIYTDSLSMNLDEEMIKNLFAAADRYGMERMKLKCGSILYDRLDVGNVLTTLALAEKHRCRMLKDACIQFILSSERIKNDVLRGQGFEQLKATCPAVLVEIWQKECPDVFERNTFNIGLRNQDSREEPENDRPIPDVFGRPRYD